MKTLKTLLIPLLICNLGWALAWILVCLITNGWLSGLFWLRLFGILAIQISIFLLVPNSIAIIVSLFRWIFEKKLSLVAMLPLTIVIVVYFSGAKIPSKPEVAFCLHRKEYIETVESVVNEFPDSDESQLRLPQSPLYERAWAYQDFSAGELAIELIIGDVYLPLIYLSLDKFGVYPYM